MEHERQNTYGVNDMKLLEAMCFVKLKMCKEDGIVCVHDE